MTSACKRRRRRRLSGPRAADERSRKASKSHRARVQTRHAAQTQDPAKDRPQKIRGRIFDQQRIRPNGPNFVSGCIEPELHPVEVIHTQKPFRRLPHF
jgi:hypothetical protein